MKKPNITEGEWEFNDHGRIYVWGNGPETKGYTPNIAKVSIWTDAPEKGRANAKAIVTAVNNTYHKGIDPEAVPDMKEALIKAKSTIARYERYYCDKEGEVYNEHENTTPQIDEALEKAGVNRNAKAE